MSAKKKLTGREHFYTYVVPKIISVGASVVILGALFKLMHWPGAGYMLIAGLGTEALIFFITAFAPIEAPHEQPDWNKLVDVLSSAQPGGQALDKNVAAKLAALEAQLADKIQPQMIDQFGQGLKKLAENVDKMTKLGDAAVATADYAKNVKLAANQVAEMNKSYSVAIEAVGSMAEASKDAKAYHAQIQALTKTLASLNTAYEMELQDSKKYIEALNKYYGSISTAMQNVADASKDTEQFKVQLANLTGNLTALNKVYGAMLTAMKGAAQ